MKAKSNSGFKRLSLADQVAGNLKEAIRTGQVKDRLPAERTLCRMVNASRPIIREALHLLRDEGLLRVVRGQRAEIIRSGPDPGHGRERNRVILLYTEPRTLLSCWQLIVIDEIRRKLYDRGFDFELVMEPGLNRKRPGARLQALVDQYQAKHWILAGTSAAVQEWFQQRPLHVVTMGNAFPHTHFPFINDDLRAVTRHAANVFIGLGHRNIAFLMREKGAAGEIEEEAGFCDAFRPGQGATGLVVKHSGRVETVRERLQSIFSRTPTVTALLLSHAEDTLTAFNWFLQKGIRTPQDVSLISYQWESFLECLRPLPAWYYTDPKEHARKICRLAVSAQPGRRSPSLIIPKFFKNETVARPGGR